MDATWIEQIGEEFEKSYFKQIQAFLLEEDTNKCEIYPQQEKVFAALEATPFNAVNVVIIGQDPYHGIDKNTLNPQANGLCFSVNNGCAFPPSLRNIFKELSQDLKLPIPSTGDLNPWAKQGVLLLNSTLTVRANQAGSHQNCGWEDLTDVFIRKVAEEKENVVFLLWGNYARKKEKLISYPNRHLILKANHPSPLSANRGGFFGSNHFSQTNNYLKKNGLLDVDWQI